MMKWFEEFFFKWFTGPQKDTEAYRELAYTIGALREERPGFSRNNIYDWITCFTKIKPLYGKENLYLSIAFYDSSIRIIGYHYLYYDFDNEENPQLAIRKGLEFARNIRERYGATPVTYLSGRKGLGIIVPLKGYVDWETYELLWRTLIQPYRYMLSGLVDVKVLEPRRVHRIPYTYNIKLEEGRPTKKLSRIIDLEGKPIRAEEFDWDNYEPLDPSKMTVYRIKPSLVKPKIIVADKRAEKPPLPSSIEELAESKAVPPCIRNVIEAMVKSGDIDHYQRLILVWYLKWIGFSVDQVVEFFRRHAKDFNEKITRYQVEYAYGLRGSRKDYLMPRCDWLKQHGICLDCGWNRNPVTYTYSRAQVPEEIKQRFFNMVKGGVSSHTGYQINSTATGLGQTTATLSRVQVAAIPSWLRDFLGDTGLREFTYDDLKQWFESKDGVTAKQWHNIARTLRKLAEQGLLGRKFLVNGQWIDYGSRKIRNPPSKTVKFYVKG